MRWEHDLLAFLRRELASSPGRLRATARLVVVCLLAVALVMALHIPQGEFMLVSLFVVSLANAGASIEKARLRVVGTLLAGAIAIVALAMCADKPWLLFPLHGILVGIAMFLSRTTTAPYAFLLAGVTFVMVVPVYPGDAVESLHIALWRVALTALGVILAMGAQLVLWPDDPELLLVADLARRLRDTDDLLSRLLAPRGSVAIGEGVAVTGLTGQLDLLQNAETRSRWVRQRHAEQVQLIIDVQRVVTTTRRLGVLAAQHPLPAWLLPRLAAVRAACARTAIALEQRQPVTGMPDLTTHEEPDVTTLDPTALEMLAIVHEVERAVGELPAAMGFLTQGATTTTTAPAPIREPLAELRLLTPDCTLANHDAVAFAIKTGVATTICALVMEATDAPGLSTSIITCVVVAQSFFGAGLRKGMLRLAGATVGSLIAILVIVSVMPNMETLASILIVSALIFGAAAWVISGSTRSSYIGLQMAIVMALTVINPGSPTTDLVPVRDRILGILLGIAVMGVVDVMLWPVFGRVALRRTLAEALQEMAALLRAAAAGDIGERRARALTVYRTLGSALTMQDDIQLEPTIERAPERDAVLRLTSAVQRVFMRLLSVTRHRQYLPPAGAPADLARLDARTAAVLDGLGRRLTGGVDVVEVPTPPAPTQLGTDVPSRELAQLYDNLLAAIAETSREVDALVRLLGTVTAATPETSRRAPRPRTPAPQPT